MLKTDKAALSAALNAANSIVKATNTIPILQNVLIEREGDMLVARGGDMDMEIAARCSAGFGANFRPFTVSSARLTEIVKNAPETTVTIDAVDDPLTAVVIRSGRSKLKLPTLPADTFPKLDASTISHRLTLAAEVLSGALNAVSYAADRDIKTRPYLGGVFFDGESSGLNLVATDGKRIERRMIPAIAFDDDVGLEGMPKVIVGSSTVARMNAVMTGSDDVSLELSTERIRLTAGDVVLTSKLIEGVFPDWRRVVPTPGNKLYRLPIKPMTEAIGRVMIVNKDGGNGVRMVFEAGSVAIEARDIDGSDAREDLPLEFDEDIIVGYHGGQFCDVLDHMKGDTAELYISEPNAPAVLHPVGDDVNLTVLIPMTVKGFYDGR